jgi:hypothetical protein
MILSVFCIILARSIGSLPLDGPVDPSASTIVPPIPDRIINTVTNRINKSLNPVTDYDIHIGKGGFNQAGKSSGSESTPLGTGMPLKTKDFFDTDPRRVHRRPKSNKVFAAGNEDYNPDVDPYTPIDEYTSKKQKPYKEHYNQYSPRDSTSTHLEEYASYDNHDNYHDDTEYMYDDDYSDYDDEDDSDYDYDDDYDYGDDYSNYAGDFNPTYDYHFNDNDNDNNNYNYNYNNKKYSYSK